MDSRWLSILFWRLKRLFRLPPPHIAPTISRRQLEEAIQVQRQTGEHDITKILISLNMIGERERQMARAQELGLGFVDIYRVEIPSETLACLDAETAQRLQALPVKKEKGTLWIAVSEFPDAAKCAELKAAAGCRIIPVLAESEALRLALRS